MASRIVRLSPEVAVEVTEAVEEVPAARVSTGLLPSPVERGIDSIKPTLLAVCRPIVEAWKVLETQVQLSEAEIEFGLSFEGEGNLFVSKMTAGANLVVTLKLKPVAPVTVEASHVPARTGRNTRRS